MAVDPKQQQPTSSFVIALNVLLMVVLAVAIVVGLQWIGYSYSTRADITTTGVNSLSEGTVALLDSLDTKVHLTSLYFTTDLEDEDQARYRSTVEDLLNLYRVTNRSMITVDTINPLQDHEKRKELFEQLGQLDKFKKQREGHEAVIDTFQKDLAPQMRDLFAAENAQLDALGTLAPQDSRLIGQVKFLYSRLPEEIEGTLLDISDAVNSEVPAYNAATNVIRSAYSNVQSTLQSVIDVSSQVANAQGQFSPAVEDFFANAQQRYGDLLASIKEQVEKIGGLEPLDFDNMMRQLRNETSNAILVRTADDAEVIGFSDIWRPVDSQTMNPGFTSRRFLGEQKLTAAILKLTQEQKPAVVFVRFGGAPLFMGGFMPNQPRPAYSEMRQHLEDLNFGVYEWDLSAQDAMPEIDPAPSRTMFVVLRPPPQQMPMGQAQPPTLTPDKIKLLTDAMGDEPRAIFLTGYQPGMMGMGGDYEYADYLRENWGIDAPCDRLIMDTEPIAPGKYQLTRGGFAMVDVSFSNHPIVAGLAASPTTFPLASPISRVDTLPEGVDVDRLAWLEPQDGRWATNNVQYYLQQRSNEFLVKSDSDFMGTFEIAMAATRDEGKGKIVVVSASEFATDSVAFAAQMMLTGQGLVTRQVNPGNVTFFVNSLHWLNDNTEWMNLGSPIDTSTITVERDSPAMKFVQVLVVALWPGLALCFGLVVWWVRRS